MTEQELIIALERLEKIEKRIDILQSQIQELLNSSQNSLSPTVRERWFEGQHLVRKDIVTYRSGPGVD